MFTKFRYITFIIVLFVVCLSTFSFVNGETVKFNTNLSWDYSPPSLAVKNLQTFLTEQGHYNGPVTGKYLRQTYDAVIRFQNANDIVPSGYFGPKTRAKANEIVLVKSKSVLATTSKKATIPPSVSTGNIVISTPTDIINNQDRSLLLARVLTLYNQIMELQKKIFKLKQNEIVVNPPSTTPPPSHSPAPTPTPTPTSTPVVVTPAPIPTPSPTPTPIPSPVPTPQPTPVPTPAPIPVVTSPLPTISAIKISSITQTSAIVSWTTNVFTKSFLQYGTSTAYKFKVDSSGTTLHTVGLTNLTAGTKYNYRISSTDSTNRNVLSTNQEFTTSAMVINPTPPPAPTPAPSPVIPPVATTSRKMLWGAYVGPASVELTAFETQVGREVNIRSIFYGMEDNFPMHYTTTLGSKGKTMLLFWEPQFGYDQIINGSKDAYMRKFALDAKAYGYPVILAPFHEMNGNWSHWGYGVNGNTASKFNDAWRRMHSFFTDVPNVKFAAVYNSNSVPDVAGNQIKDYYPGSNYVDYVGIDGFNFGSPWQSFKTIFDSPLKQVAIYNKPIYIFSTGSVSAGPQDKANWIKDAFGTQVYNYPTIEGWVWFNQHAFDGNWLLDSDPNALNAFKSIIPK